MNFDGGAIARTAAELMRFASTGGDEEPVLDHIAGWLAARNVAVARERLGWERLAAHPMVSAEIDRDHVEVLTATVEGAAPGGVLLLNAHVDVVPAAAQDGWSHAPFEPQITDGVLSGRGSADTKGGLAAAMHVLAALAAAPESFAGKVVLTPVPGEEDGGCGTLASLLAAGGAAARADAAVVIEPTDLAIGVASAGALCFRVRVAGRTAHGSVRHTGVSAIEKAWPIHQAILRLEARRAAALPHPLYEGDVPFPICMGRIEGGDYLCDEAAWVHVDGRFGSHPAEPVADARAALESAVADACAADAWLAENPATVEWIGAQWLGGDTPVDDPLVTALAAAAPGSPIIGVPYGCDMGLLRQVADIPTVVFGPGSADVAHAPDEHVAVADLAAAADALLALATQQHVTGPV